MRALWRRYATPGASRPSLLHMRITVHDRARGDPTERRLLRGWRACLVVYGRCKYGLHYITSCFTMATVRMQRLVLMLTLAQALWLTRTEMISLFLPR